MTTTLDELKQLNNVELGVLCHDYQITPGHVTTENRAPIERRLLIAIMKARGKEHAKVALQQRPVQRGESVASVHQSNDSLPGSRLRPSKIPVYKTHSINLPRYTRRTGGAINSIANSQHYLSLPKMHENFVETASGTQNDDELENDKDELKSTSHEPLKFNAVFVENATNAEETQTENSMHQLPIQVDKLCQTPGVGTTDNELEIRTINYLSKEQEVKLTTDRNTQEYMQNLNEVITSTAAKDNVSDELGEHGRQRRLYYSRNIRLACVGAAIVLCAAVIYRNVK